MSNKQIMGAMIGTLIITVMFGVLVIGYNEDVERNGAIVTTTKSMYGHVLEVEHRDIGF